MFWVSLWGSLFIPSCSTSLVSRAKTDGLLEVVETKTQTCTYVQIKGEPLHSTYCDISCCKLPFDSFNWRFWLKCWQRGRGMWGISNFDLEICFKCSRQRPIPMHLNMAHNSNIGIFFLQLEQICLCYKIGRGASHTKNKFYNCTKVLYD